MHSPGHSSADSTTESSDCQRTQPCRRTLRVALRLGEDLVALFHVGKTIVEQREHVGRDFLAKSVAGAEILVNPNLHGWGLLRERRVVISQSVTLKRSPFTVLPRELPRSWVNQ